MSFKNLLDVLGMGCCFKKEQMCIFDEFPIEVIIMILEYLDPRSLIVMSRLNKKLFSICQNNRCLSDKIYEEVRRQKIQLVQRLLSPQLEQSIKHSENINSVYGLQDLRAIQGRSDFYDLGSTSVSKTYQQRPDIESLTINLLADDEEFETDSCSAPGLHDSP